MDESFIFDLFLSYANADRAWVEGYLISALGISRERIITSDNFQLGAARVNEMERAVKTSRYTLLILSPAYLTDEWSNLGEQLASYLTTTEAQTRLIPLLKAKCEIPLHIDFRVRLDCTEKANRESQVARLRDLLNQPAAQPERIECPYPGMIPFRVEDARWFYGRDKEIDELVRRVRLQNFLFVIGPSGSGKSSLVFAGLVAELNKRQPDAWLVKTIRTGSDPLAVLNDSITQLLNHPTNQLLIIDQFEELFTLADKSQQAAFIARLKSLRSENRCIIVATMRADFYPNLMNSDLWPLDSSERIEIAPLRGESLRQAIVKPAEQIGVYFEEGLVEQLVADAADEPGVLPLVQETMVLLWEKLEWRLLTRQAYQDLGRGKQSGLAAAVATHADAVFLQLAKPQHTIARRIFLRLIQFGEGRADTRRQQPVSALRASNDDADEFDRTLKHLTDHRLLTSNAETRDGERKIDIAHEALITGWNRLRDWVNERRDAEQTRRRLETKASEWERLGRGDAGLLDAIELREAEIWLKSADAEDLGYSEPLSALVGVSQITIQQAEQEKEQTRQRELAQAKSLADEQRQRAETERRSRLRQRYFTIGLAVFLILTIVAAGIALVQYVEALRQQQISDSRRLASQSTINRDTNFGLALLLGVESIRLDNNLEAQSALLDSLTSKPKLTAYLYGHTSLIWEVAFSPDGKMLASGSDEGASTSWGRAVTRIVHRSAR